MLLPASLLVLLSLASPASGHGRLMDPPARNSMWRLGFPNPVNYNDNELYCGGRVTQWARNKGQCGVCGDPHHHTNKDHEVGGKYANGIISRQYKKGQVIDVAVHITANHKGYFEFRICPVEKAGVEVTQECLDKHVLELEGAAGTRYKLAEGKSNSFFNISLRLPTDMTCTQCVIQWKYRTGNTWDKDEGGNFCLGCGPQEEFYNCADVTINGEDKNQNETPNAQKPVENKSTAGNETPNKNDVPVITDKNIPGKITDYGKNKINFFQNIRKNVDYTSNESENAWREDDKETQKPNIVNEASKIQTGTTVRSLNFNDDNQNANLVSVVAKDVSQPSAVAFRWKAETTISPSVENIRRRFGFGGGRVKGVVQNKRWGGQSNLNKLEKPATNSGSERNVDSRTASPVKQEVNRYYNKQQNKQVVVGHNRVGHDSQRDRGSKSKVGLDSQIKRGSLFERVSKSGQESQSSLDLGLQLDQVSHSGTRSQTELGSQSKLASNPNIISRPQHNIHQLNTVPTRLPTNPRTNPQKVPLNPYQRDNFLRRWKLLRLKYIAAMRELNSSKSSTASPAKLLTQGTLAPFKLPKQTSGTLAPFKLPKQTSGTLAPSKPRFYQGKTSTRRMFSSTAAPLKVQDARYNNEIHNIGQISTARSSLKQTVQTKLQNSRKDFLRKKLPSWLILALRLKHQESVSSNDNKNSDTLVATASAPTDLERNAGSDKNDVNIKSNTRTEQQGTVNVQGNSRTYTEKIAPKWYNNGNKPRPVNYNIGSSNLAQEVQLPTLDTPLNENILGNKKIETTRMDETSAKMKLLGGVKSNKYILKTAQNEESNIQPAIGNPSNQDTESPSVGNHGNQDTESLVRYIVKLLYSRHEGQSARKSSDQTKIKNQINADNSDSTKNVLDSASKNKSSAGNSWFVPGHVERQVAMTDLNNNGIGNRGFYHEKETFPKSGSAQIDVAPQNSVHYKEKSRLSERVHALPYNQMILGSSYGNKKGHAMSGSQNNNEGVQYKPFSVKDTLDAQRDSLSRVKNNNYMHNKQSQVDVGYNNAIPKTQQMRENGVASDTDVTIGNQGDYHHIWTARSQSRQDYYNRKDESDKPELICKSLVTLGGGMDRWCVDNCKANFCPPSMCVCKPKSPDASSYTSQRLSMPSRSSLQAWGSSVQGKPDTSVQRMYGRPSYAAKSGDYIERSGSLQENGRHTLRHPLSEYDESYFKPSDRSSSVHLPAMDNSFIKNNYFENMDHSESRSRNVIGQDSNYFQELPRIVQSENVLDSNAGRSLNSGQFYSENLIRPGYDAKEFYGRGLSRQHNPRNYHNQELLLNSSPYIGNNDNNNNIQKHQTTRLNWFSRARENERSQPNEQDVGGKIPNGIKPYSNLDGPVFSGKANTLSEIFSQNANYNLNQELGNNHVGQMQFPSKISSLNNPIWQDVRPRLQCRAVGEYTGMKHFDEWCELTCASSMCPLLICSCES